LLFNSLFHFAKIRKCERNTKEIDIYFLFRVKVALNHGDGSPNSWLFEFIGDSLRQGRWGLNYSLFVLNVEKSLYLHRN